MMRGKGEGEEEIGRMNGRVQECLIPNLCVIHTGVVLIMKMNMDVPVSVKQGGGGE